MSLVLPALEEPIVVGAHLPEAMLVFRERYGDADSWAEPIHEVDSAPMEEKITPVIERVQQRMAAGLPTSLS